MNNDLRTLGDPGSELFQVDAYPFYLLNRASSRYNVVIEAELRRIGLDIPTWRVLMILGERSPMPIGKVARLAVINLSTTMRVIGRMEVADLVQSAPNQGDGRVTDVTLTETGAIKLTQARQATSPIYRKLIRGMSARDFSKLLQLLNLLHANLT